MASDVTRFKIPDDKLSVRSGRHTRHEEADDEARENIDDGERRGSYRRLPQEDLRQYRGER